MMLNNWLQQKQDAAKAAAADPAEQPATPASRPVELTTQEIAALALFLGKDTESGYRLSKIATDEVSEEAMASDGIQCLVLHVPELNVDAKLYAIPVPGLSAERGEKFPDYRATCDGTSEHLFSLDLRRLERVVDALRLITFTNDNDVQVVRVAHNIKTGLVYFVTRTERGKATVVMAPLKDEEDQ